MFNRIRKAIRSALFLSSTDAPAFDLDPTLLLNKDSVEDQVRRGTLFAGNKYATLHRFWLHAHSNETWARILLTQASTVSDLDRYVTMLGIRNNRLGRPIQMDPDAISKFTVLDWIHIEKELIVHEVQSITKGEASPSLLVKQRQYIYHHGRTSEDWLMSRNVFITNHVGLSHFRLDNYNTIVLHFAVFTAITTFLLSAFSSISVNFIVGNSICLWPVVITSVINTMLIGVAGRNVISEYKRWYASTTTVPWRFRISAKWDDVFASKNGYDLVLLSSLIAALHPAEIGDPDPTHAVNLRLPGATPLDLLDFCQEGVTVPDVMSISEFPMKNRASAIQVPTSFQEQLICEQVYNQAPEPTNEVHVYRADNG